MSGAAGLMFRQMAIDVAGMPYPDFTQRIKQIVLDAIVRCWDGVVSDARAQGVDLGDCSETQVTSLLEARLNALLDSRKHAFSGAVFQHVTRDSSQVTINAGSLDKKPDLTFRLLPAPTAPYRRVLHGECKLVSTVDSVREYGAAGICRFVNGEYGWSMPSGIMVAYCSTEVRPDRELAAHLGRSAAASPSTYLTIQMPLLNRALHATVSVFESVHDRACTYPGTTRSPGKITLIHLWLNF